MVQTNFANVLKVLETDDGYDFIVVVAEGQDFQKITGELTGRAPLERVRELLESGLIALTTQEIPPLSSVCCLPAPPVLFVQKN